MDNFEDVVLNKIDNKEKLTERELKTLAYEFAEEEEEGDNRRWSQGIISYILLKDRYFVLQWERGLTECQENGFYYQPYEVEKKTYEKTIPEHKVMVTEWIKK